VYALAAALLSCHEPTERLDPAEERAQFESSQAQHDDELGAKGIDVRKIRADCELARPTGKRVDPRCFWDRAAEALRAKER